MTKKEVIALQAELQAGGYYEDFRELDGIYDVFTLAAEMNAHAGTSLGGPGRKLAIQAARAAAAENLKVEQLRGVVPHLVAALTHGPLHHADTATVLIAAIGAATLP